MCTKRCLTQRHSVKMQTWVGWLLWVTSLKMLWTSKQVLCNVYRKGSSLEIGSQCAWACAKCSNTGDQEQGLEHRHKTQPDTPKLLLGVLEKQLYEAWERRVWSWRGGGGGAAHVQLVCGCFCSSLPELSRWDADHMALSRKSQLTFGLELRKKTKTGNTCEGISG